MQHLTDSYHSQHRQYILLTGCGMDAWSSLHGTADAPAPKSYINSWGPSKFLEGPDPLPYLLVIVPLLLKSKTKDWQRGSFLLLQRMHRIGYKLSWKCRYQPLLSKDIWRCFLFHVAFNLKLLIWLWNVPSFELCWECSLHYTFPYCCIVMPG